MKTTKLILASSSPQRRKILKDAGYKFEILHPKISERISSKNPIQIVKSLALKKAKAVKRTRLRSPRLKIRRGGRPTAQQAGLIIGADTIVVLRGEIIGKPRHENDARKILGKLSGSRHFVYTGVAILDTVNKKQIVDYEKTEVNFRKLTEANIDYASKKYLDKAGAYSVQSKGDRFVKNIKGDYLNVVGFPLKKFQKMLALILQKG